MNTITITIPTDWLAGQSPSPDELRQALQLGLAQLQQRQGAPQVTGRVIQALLKTGRVRHLSPAAAPAEARPAKRQPPPTLPGPPVSQILLAQRRGNL